MTRVHHYETTVQWSAGAGVGTADYRSYSRTHTVNSPGLVELVGSADRTFRGDPLLWNPELLLLAALSQCHLLSYLSVCAGNGVVVTGYVDTATGTMAQSGGSGRFIDALLRPEVTVADAATIPAALELHGAAHDSCFIANSVNFPVRHEPTVRLVPTVRAVS